MLSMKLHRLVIQSSYLLPRCLGRQPVNVWSSNSKQEPGHGLVTSFPHTFIWSLCNTHNLDLLNQPVGGDRN
uniref:Uncharacterized protein n=1 Tax=Aegilops tauschii subsp. strangulata TaxID=200361 RepID=A0A453AVM9_AEGTS